MRISERVNLPCLVALGIAIALLSCIVHAQTSSRTERLLTLSQVVNCEDRSTDLTQCPFIGYRIEHASSCTATAWTLVAEVPKDQLTYRATGLTSGTHCWRVRAYSSDFTTAPGPVPAIPQATVTALRPGQPGAVTASP